LWGDRYNDNVVDYLVAEARAMNLNCFRTYTQPPPAAWLVGRGEILMNQLHIRGRISPAADACDPVAERMLVNLLTR